MANLAVDKNHVFFRCIFKLKSFRKREREKIEAASFYVLLTDWCGTWSVVGWHQKPSCSAYIRTQPLMHLAGFKNIPPSYFSFLLFFLSFLFFFLSPSFSLLPLSFVLSPLSHTCKLLLHETADYGPIWNDWASSSAATKRNDGQTCFPLQSMTEASEQASKLATRNQSSLEI